MKYVFIAALLSVSTLHAAELRIEAFKAPFHVGESVMACGVLAQVTSASKQVYLSLDKPYPNQTLTVLVWKTDYPKFTQRFGNLNQYVNKQVCARGVITAYKNTLQIQMSNPQFLRIME